MSQSQSLTDVDRLSAALLTLVQASDTKASSSALLSGSKTFVDDRKNSCQHSPLSAATSLPWSAERSTCTPRQQWRWSSVDGLTTSAAPPSLGGSGILDEHGARTTTTATGPRYKTELCRTFAEHGTCRYGDKCQFAHGRDDLRTVVRHPKYKTDLCRTYHSTGLCPYGPRCHFIHNEDETRSRPTTAKQRHVELAARELELRLALMNLYQREKLASQSVPTSYFHSTPSAVAVPQWRVPLDRRQSMPHTVPQSSMFTSPVVSGTLDSAGGSPSSSAADDESPPPLSPTLGVVDDRCGQLSAASNDRLTALIVLATRLRLLQATTTTH